MKYVSTVDQIFLDKLEEKVKNDKRPDSVARSQFGFEVVEYSLGKIPGSGHTWYEGYDHDTEHGIYGNCDFKYHNKYGKLTISSTVKEWIEQGLIDTFITWKYISRDPYKHLELGEKIKFELLMYIDAKTVYNNLIQTPKKDRNGDPVYEYICS